MRESKEQKMNYQVPSDMQAKTFADSASMRAEFCNYVSVIIPRSCFTEFMKGNKKKQVLNV